MPFEEVTGKEGAFLEDVPVALLRTLRESFEGELGDADVSVLEDVVVDEAALDSGCGAHKLAE